MEVGRRVFEDESLKMAVFVTNTTVGPEGHSTLLLVFGAIPRHIRTKASESQVTIARAVESEILEVEKIQSKRIIEFGLNHVSGSKRWE